MKWPHISPSCFLLIITLFCLSPYLIPLLPHYPSSAGPKTDMKGENKGKHFRAEVILWFLLWKKAEIHKGNRKSLAITK